MSKFVASGESRFRANSEQSAPKPGLLLPAPATRAGKPLRFIGGTKQRHGLIDTFLLLELRFGIGDDPSTRLNIHLAVLEERRAQSDAGVHLLSGRKISDATGVEGTLFFFYFVDDLHRAHFRSAGDGPGRETGRQRFKRPAILAQSSLDIRHDVHDLAVALNEELVGHFDGAYLGNPADVVAAEIEQHEVLGALLGIGEEFGFKRQIFARRSAAWPRAGDRANSDDPAGGLDHDFRAGSRYGKVAEIKKIKIRRRINAAQCAVERKWRQRERQFEALREHDLKNVAGGYVVLRALDHALEFGRGRVGRGLDEQRLALDFSDLIERPVKRMHHRQ